MTKLDEIQQRVLGVLIEKERTVPDSYPMTENSLLNGCNQKSNRDPEMALDHTEIGQALMTLREDAFLARVEGSGRATKYRHRAEERLNVDRDEVAVLCELLLRGPQAPGALKPRIARLGCSRNPDEILGILERLAQKSPTPLVERLPKRPRERDHRFGHLLGPRPQAEPECEPGDAASGPAASGGVTSVAGAAEHAPTRTPSAGPTDRSEIAKLREELQELRDEVAWLREAFEDLGRRGGGS